MPKRQNERNSFGEETKRVNLSEVSKINVLLYICCGRLYNYST